MYMLLAWKVSEDILCLSAVLLLSSATCWRISIWLLFFLMDRLWQHVKPLFHLNWNPKDQMDLWKKERIHLLAHRVHMEQNVLFLSQISKLMFCLKELDVPAHLTVLVRHKKANTEYQEIIQTSSMSSQVWRRCEKK